MDGDRFFDPFGVVITDRIKHCIKSICHLCFQGSVHVVLFKNKSRLALQQGDFAFTDNRRAKFRSPCRQTIVRECL